MNADELSSNKAEPWNVAEAFTLVGRTRRWDPTGRIYNSVDTPGWGGGGELRVGP